MALSKVYKVAFWVTVLFCISCSQKKKNSSVASNRIEHNYSDTNYIFGTNQLRVDSIPDSVFLMSYLKHLAIIGMDCSPEIKYLDENKNKIDTCYKLKEISIRIKDLSELTSLALSENKITHIPKEIVELKKLRILNLQDNPLDSVNGIEELKTLEELYLHGCKLEKLPDSIGNLVNLKILGLNRTQLSKAEQMRIKKALPYCNIQFPD